MGPSGLVVMMDARPRVTESTRGLVLGTLAGAAVTGLWVGMSLATDLIWHLHPALVGIVAGWGYRRGLDRAGRRGEVAALVAVTAVLVAAGGIAIAAGDKSLDPGWFVALVAAAGLGVGLGLLTRA